MVETSPSSRKVDDFLTSLSQLSQDRLREDQKRQRSLQRNIDELRQRLNSSSPVKSQYGVSRDRSGSTYSQYSNNIPSLSFNRSSKVVSSKDQFYKDLAQLDDSQPPEMPTRPGRTYDDKSENPPAMPSRPDSSRRIFSSTSSPPDSIPRRTGDSEEEDIEKMYSGVASMSMNINLVKPVGSSKKPFNYIDARQSDKTPPPKPARKSDFLKSRPQSPSTNNNYENKRFSGYDKAHVATDSNDDRGYSRNRSRVTSIGTTENTVVDATTGATRITYIDARNDPGNTYASYERDPITPKTTIFSHGKSPTLTTNTLRDESTKKQSNSSFTDMESNIKQGIRYDNNPARRIFNDQTLLPEPEDGISSSTPSRSYKPMKPAKSDWLSSTMQNSGKSDSSSSYAPKPSYHNAISAAQAAKVKNNISSSTSPNTPSKNLVPNQDSSMSNSPSWRLDKTPRSWLDSVVSREGLDSHTYTDPNRRKFSITKKSGLTNASEDSISQSTSRNTSPCREKNPNSWLDSVAEKVGSSHKYVEAKPSFTIVKKDGTSTLDLHKPEEQPKEPDYLSLLAKFRKDGNKLPPPKPTSKKPTSEEVELLRLQKEKIAAKAKSPPPPKPSKLPVSRFEQKDEDLLRTQLGRLSPTKTSQFDRSPKRDYESQDQELLRNQLDKLGSGNPPQTPRNFAHKYEEQDAEILKSQLSKLGSGNHAQTPKSSYHNYEEQDTELLRSQLKNLGSKTPKSLNVVDNKDKLNENPEGLRALTKLKPAKAPPQKPSEKPEALKTLEKLKAAKQRDIKDNGKQGSDSSKEQDKATKDKKEIDSAKKNDAKTELEKQDVKSKVNNTRSVHPLLSKQVDSKNLEPNEGNVTPPSSSSFQDKLSSIIRTNTAPSLTNNSPTGMSKITRSSTVPFSRDSTSSATKKNDTSGDGKLIHVNKTRSKGPKRRLPKNVQGKPATTNENGVSTKGPVSGDSAFGGDLKKKKVPPPIRKASKPKNLEDMKPSRQFSGELFI